MPLPSLRPANSGTRHLRTAADRLADEGRTRLPAITVEAAIWPAVATAFPATAFPATTHWPSRPCLPTMASTTPS